MTEFILVDLRTQMPYLPCEMRAWGRERILRWLRVYGEVIWHGDPDNEYLRFLQAKVQASQEPDLRWLDALSVLC
jgi:hypothetical protein